MIQLRHVISEVPVGLYFCWLRVIDASMMMSTDHHTSYV
ncbi:hypothetical protein ABI_40700 [Asticcacaulis biprosthecium C19]|uniref:Uncharacterized protein n=1 Tax=Asticcacaulis biprosthecium C19 TaxID=715226 RepID=F4QSC6_9CAUL|nr:hypothetical protein ABI_40700 [Asticcacaulis biprosthecium C19]